MAYTAESAAAVRAASNIVDIVGERVQLKKAGINLQGLCPFHQEKTPSFTVHPGRNTYKCFGCGVGGDAVDFLIRSGKTFPEALQIISQKTGIPLEKDAVANHAESSGKTAARATAAILQAQFLYTDGAAQYWGPRGYTPETLDAFGVGVCDGTKPQHVTDEALDTIGATNDAGNLIFYKRTTIPIHDAMGNVIAWGARTMEANPETAKYINSPRTVLYDKAATWFNLHRAAPHIRRTGEVWICEGYADAMALHQWGICNVLALSGTAISDTHIHILRRFNGDKPLRIVLCFDNETSGETKKDAVAKAYRAALEKLLPVGEVVAPIYPKGCKDMGDTLTRKQTPAEFAKKDVISLWVENTYTKEWAEKASPAEVAAYQEDIARLIACVKKENIRDIYINSLSGLLKASPKAMAKMVGEIRTEGETTAKNKQADQYKYIKVADDYYERQINYDIFSKSSTVVYVRRKRQELCSEGVAVTSLKRFHNWIIEPEHLKYRRVVEVEHEGEIFSFFNSYHPLPFTPKPFDIPQAFKDDPSGYDIEKIPEIQNIARFYKHIFDWEAYRNQYLLLGLDWTTICYLHPAQRLPALALVSSEEGTGKSTFINLLMAMFGENACKTDALRIGQNFNAMSAGKLLTCVEETKDQRGDIENKLKDLITGFEKVVEAKHQDAKVVKAFDKFIFASNHEDSFMKVGTETTRFFVMKVKSIQAKDSDFEEKLYREIPYFLYFLQQRGVITPKTDRLWFEPKLLENEALLRLRQSSKDQVQQNIEELFNLIWLRCGIAEPMLYVSSQYLKMLVSAYGGKQYEQKAPTYFQKVATDMRLNYDDVPRRRDAVELVGIHTDAWINADAWAYDYKKTQARFITFPIWLFVKPSDIEYFPDDKKQQLITKLRQISEPRAQAFADALAGVEAAPF